MLFGYLATAIFESTNCIMSAVRWANTLLWIQLTCTIEYTIYKTDPRIKFCNDLVFFLSTGNVVCCKNDNSFSIWQFKDESLISYLSKARQCLRRQLQFLLSSTICILVGFSNALFRFLSSLASISSLELLLDTFFYFCLIALSTLVLVWPFVVCCRSPNHISVFVILSLFDLLKDHFQKFISVVRIVFFVLLLVPRFCLNYFCCIKCILCNMDIGPSLAF